MSLPSKLLIANRGEIACRIIRTARSMGIRTVAVYSQADARAYHTSFADEAVLIGPADATRSYLSIPAIIDACRHTNSEAVHPGYGFLSENEEFASRLTEAGIVFVGPNRHALAVMGDKIQSKKTAQDSGVSVVPGFVGAIASEKQAIEIANELGYPVMLKASAGGGGKGIRIAYSDSETMDGLLRARSEAQQAFGDDRILIEKYIENPRHIEIQVLGDKHGNVVHLGERECSIQRRNQKVIEEAPSPLLSAETRAEMGGQAVALAKSVGYDSAGTVEFVVGQDQSFYFLEMNTRLQVEHPVTEYVTGVDLVEQMIRIAAGAPLPFQQSDITLSGWAVESRIYAEDPVRGFVPSAGRVSSFMPPSSPGVRVDTGIRAGDEITSHYDPMIAKLITHASSRDEAIAAQAAALDGFVIRGIRHNIPFLSAIMAHPRWQEGRLSTRFIEEEFPKGFREAAPPSQQIPPFVALAAYLDVAQEILLRGRSGAHSFFPFVRERAVRSGGTDYVAVVSQSDEQSAHVSISGGEELAVRGLYKPGHPVWQGAVGETPVTVQIQRTGANIRLDRGGYRFEARVLPVHTSELAKRMPADDRRAATSDISCPMPGIVQAVFVSGGDHISPEDPVAVIEAMKTEFTIRAPHSGTVASVHIIEGDSVQTDQLIARLSDG